MLGGECLRGDVRIGPDPAAISIAPTIADIRDAPTSAAAVSA